MKILLSFLLVCALATSSPVTTPRVVHERRSAGINLGKGSRIDGNAILPVRIGLVQSNLDRGYDHLISVSHPSSASYGKHWTAAEVDAEFAPSEVSVEAVKQWLRGFGINADQSANKGWLAFDAPADLVEHLLHTEFLEYRSGSDGAVTISCEQYSLPEHIGPLVDYVTPGVKASPRLSKRSRFQRPAHAALESRTSQEATSGLDVLPDDLKYCNFNITPPCLRALYGIPVPPANGTISNNTLGIFENSGAYSQEDLDKFFHHFAPYVPNGTHPELVSINGATAPASVDDADSEADIDFDVAYAILGASPITIYEVQVPVSDPTADASSLAPFLDAIDGSFCSASNRAAGFQCGGANLTTVLSASYSLPELFGQSYRFQQRACAEFMKLSLQGHTIVFASGDYGVATNPIFGEDLCGNNGCVPQDLDNTGESTYNGTIFVPGFPATCPYVLAVGATMVESNSTVYHPESAMNLPKVGLADCDYAVTFSSGGGFSNYNARPSYQDAAVKKYLSDYVPDYPHYHANAAGVEQNDTTIGKDGGVYNRAGRGFPDVSANGAYYSYYLQGTEQPVDGTSLAAPLWASLIAMINQTRADAGKSAVGFVHPVLYAHPEVFHDIRNGSNPGCTTEGFAAVEGWDPVTGLGTPNYPALLELFMGLP